MVNSPENNDHIEIIDNENKKIEEKLQNLEEKSALDILKGVDFAIQNFDIDLAIDRSTNTYKFLASDLRNDSPNNTLEINLRYEDIEKVGRILVNLFNNEMTISGDYHGRTIHKETWMPDGLEDKYATSYKLGDNQEIKGFTKDEVEKMFVFVMNTRGIPRDEWRITGPMKLNN